MPVEKSQSQALHKDVVYRFTIFEGIIAYSLATYGFQQLHPISETSRTIFGFTLLFGTQSALVMIMRET